MKYSYDGREARKKEKELWDYRHNVSNMLNVQIKT